MKKILIICLLFIMITGCNKAEEKPTNLKAKHEEKVIELLKNSYQHSLYTMGKLTLSESSVEMNGKEYRFIENEDIKSIDELNELLNKVYIEDVLVSIYEKSLTKKEFIMFNDDLFVHNLEEECNIQKVDNFKEFKVLKENKEHLIIKFNGNEHYVFLKDGKYYLNEIVFKCLD